MATWKKIIKAYKMNRMDHMKLTGIRSLIIFGCSLVMVNADGQALKVKLNVNSTVGIEQLMPFEVVADHDVQTLQQGMSGASRMFETMGAITITGKENTDVLIRLDAPEVLVNKEKQTMPFSMNLAWQNDSGYGAGNLVWLSNKSNVFKIGNSANVSDEKNKQDDELQACLYIKGTAEVPANAGSAFEGTVHLTIEY